MYTHKTGISYRKVHIGDLHALFDLKQESWWGTHGTFLSNIEDQRSWYESLNHNNLAMVAIEEGQKAIMGIGLYSDIDWYSRSLNASFSLVKEHRSRAKDLISSGLDFIFEVLNMRRVGAEVLESNVVAHKLEVDYLEFRIEGRRRQAVYKAGVYYDSIQLGLLRSEWEDSTRVCDLKKDTGSCNKCVDHNQIAKLLSKTTQGSAESNGSLQ